MKRLILLLFLMMGLTSVALKAQTPYKLGIGFRAGPYLGLTVKGNLAENHSLEAIAEMRRKGFLLTGLYELHLPLRDPDGLRFYVGPGLHVGYHNQAFINSTTSGDGQFIWGFDAIAGVEYTFPRIPISISADWKPFFEYWGYLRVYTDNIGFSIRYVFQ